MSPFEKDPFTIIIPTYKRPVLLKRAIESALKQTWSNIRVLVLDNASGDETKEVVEAFRKTDSRVAYICHEKNIGMLGQYQYGIEHVKTEFFSFLSDDDWLLPSFCEVSILGFKENPDCCFFASSTVIIGSENRILRIPLDLWPHEGKYPAGTGALEMIGKYPVPTTVAFRKSFLSEVSIDMNNPMAWDCDFLLQLSSRFPIAISKKVTGIFVSHDHSCTAHLSYDSVSDSIIRIIRRAPLFGTSFKERLNEKLNDYLITITGSFIKSMAVKKRYSEGALLARQLISLNPNRLYSYLLYFILVFLKKMPIFHFFIWKLRDLYRKNMKSRFTKYEGYLNDFS